MSIFRLRFFPLLLIFTISLLGACRGSSDTPISIEDNDQPLSQDAEQPDKLTENEKFSATENESKDLFLPYLESDSVDQVNDQEFDCYGTEKHKIGLSIADKFEFSYEEIMNWFCDGHQFEDILLALQTSKLISISPDELLLKRANGQVWDDIWRDIGLLYQREP
jgi:hypothetical protein